jgi:hypothetical protein
MHACFVITKLFHTLLPVSCDIRLFFDGKPRITPRRQLVAVR